MKDCRLKLILLMSIFSLPAIQSAQAAMTVTPVNGGDKISETDKYIYYGAITGSDQTLKGALFDAPEDRYFPVDITANVDNDFDSSNLLLFDIESTEARADGKRLLLTVTLGGDNGAKAMPIASVGDTHAACSGSTCQDQKAADHADFPLRFYAARFTAGQRLRVGIYPREACRAYEGVGSGCDGDNVKAPVAGPSGSVTQMSITFSIGTAEDDLAPATGAAQDSANVFLNFQLDQPKLACPNLGDAYTPGDGEIILQSGGFKVQTVGSGRAPATKLLVLGNEGKAPDLSASFTTGNTIFQRIASSGEHVIPGFTNATGPGEHLHYVSFMIRDATGMLGKSDSECALNGVQTATIDSFLQKGNCFIATAAFRSTDAAPVELLRQFRDRVLLKSKPGRTFVKFYYEHSPQAARWLLENPAFRGPVLLALAPLQAAAWFVLHPLWFTMFFLSALVFGWGVSRRVSA